MKISELLKEAVGGNYLYHGVPDGPTVMKILKSGYIKPQEPFQFDQDPDNPEPDNISLSRSQYLRFPYGHAVAQFVVDKDALTRAGIIAQPKVGAMMHYKYETEERVYKPIPVRAPFVVAIEFDPNLKIPRSFLNHATKLGIQVTPWRKEGQNPLAKPPADPGPQPQTEFTDPKKVRIMGNGYTYGNPPKRVEPTEWYVAYEDRPGHYHLLGPRSKDKTYIQKLFPQIKDRVAKRLTFDDLLPQDQYRKEWKWGYSEIQPGDPDWKEQKP
jgi:hypothetical protein